MPSWVTPANVKAAWIGEDAPTADATIQVWIDKAEREVKFRVPDLVDRIDEQEHAEPPSTELLELAKDVVTAMVIRVFRNPEGIRQQQTTTGPFSESKMYGGDMPGGLGLTDDELKKLTGRRGGAFEIDLAGRRHRHHDD